MRKIIIALALGLMATASWAKGALTFDSQTVDFGTVRSTGGTVTVRYTYTNTGDEPVGIVTVTNGGCGCTRPEFSHRPVKPGEKGEIVIHFNPSTFSGEVNREVKVQLSSQKKREKLRFSGVVIPEKKKK